MTGRIPKKLFVTLAVAVLLAATAVVLFVPGFRPRDVLFDRWLREVPTLPDAQALPRMRQLAEFGDDRLPALVPLLASERPSVAAAARVVLAEQVDRWKLLSPKQASRNVEQLARALAENVNQLGATNRDFVHDLATRLLLWPVEPSAVDSAALIANCETVLRTPPRFVSSSESTRRRADRSPARRTHNLLIEPLADPAVSRQKTDDVLPEPAARSSATTLAPLIPPRIVATLTDEAGDVSDATDKMEPREPSPLPASRRATPIAPPASAHHPWRGVSDWDVMRQLHADDVATASAAMIELRRRGLKERDFELATQLFDSDPQVRVRLAESLPELAGIDPRPWLLWLSRDTHPAVRRAAITVIATSADPELHRRLREIEREESDPEIVQQVQKMLR